MTEDIDMTLTDEMVEGLIFKALRSLQEDSQGQGFEISKTTALFGVNAQIDSLSLVSLIVDIETALNSEYGLSLSLTDDRAMSRPQSPFINVQTLKDYIVEIVQEK